SSLFFFFFIHTSLHHPYLHSFPTRRSSDLFCCAIASSRCSVETYSSLNWSASLKAWSMACDSGLESVGWIEAPLCFGSRSISARSEEHTSELQSLAYLVCRLLLEKKKKYER